MEALLKYWPIIGSFVGLLFNAFIAWVCWTLRQYAKEEVTRIVAEAVKLLQLVDASAANRLDAVEDRVLTVEGRTDGIAADIAELPTKADIARLEGEIKYVGGAVEAAAGGISRIEGFFLQRGVEKV